MEMHCKWIMHPCHPVEDDDDRYIWCIIYVQCTTEMLLVSQNLNLVPYSKYYILKWVSQAFHLCGAEVKFCLFKYDRRSLLYATPLWRSVKKIRWCCGRFESQEHVIYCVFMPSCHVIFRTCFSALGSQGLLSRGEMQGTRWIGRQQG